MNNKPIVSSDHVLNPFLAKHRDDVLGILHGFDRLRLQGSLRALDCGSVLEEYLSKSKVLWKDFKAFATELTARICQQAQQLAQAAGRPFTYLASRRLSKEDWAREIAARDQIQEGLIAVFRCVEPCRTYHARGNYATQKLELKLEWAKCLHLYFYVQHPRLGFLHLRLQTWFPFLIHICIHGPEWLARQMDQGGLHDRQADNRFTWIQDLGRAQGLMNQQLQTDWVAQGEELRRTYHPLHEEIVRPLQGLSYSWTVPQSEYASDILFRDQATLDRLFPRLVHHAIMHLGSEQVMRFLGKRCDGKFQGQVVRDLRRRSEGVRIKHWVNENSIKLYNCLNVLRPETTIHNPDDLRVYRAPETRPDEKRAWHQLRRGVADLPRRAELSRAANERYLTALAAASVNTPLAEDAAALCRPICREGQRYRALNPFGESDARWLQLINRGQWALKGFRNRDLRHALFGQTNCAQERRRKAAPITRRIALLHAHGLVAKISRTHRWNVTAKGRRLITALLAARHASTDQLISLAA